MSSDSDAAPGLPVARRSGAETTSISSASAVENASNIHISSKDTANAEKFVLEADSLQPNDYHHPLAHGILTLLKEWHQSHGRHHLPVATTSYRNPTSRFKVYGPSGRECLLTPYSVLCRSTQYIIVVLHRLGVEDVAVKCTKIGNGKAYYSI